MVVVEYTTAEEGELSAVMDWVLDWFWDSIVVTACHLTRSTHRGNMDDTHTNKHTHTVHMNTHTHTHTIRHKITVKSRHTNDISSHL